MKKVILSMFVFALLLFPSPAFALSCMPSAFLDNFRENAIFYFLIHDTVFIGTVIEKGEPTQQVNLWWPQTYESTITVDSVYKGTLPNQISTKAPFEEGKSYLFFANVQEDNTIRINYGGGCSLSASRALNSDNNSIKYAILFTTLKFLPYILVGSILAYFLVRKSKKLRSTH